MYYDRSVPAEIEALLAKDGALAWLPELLRKPHPRLGLADLQLRRDQTGRPRGAIQVYLGLTSLLEIRGTRDGVQLMAAETYQAVAPELFRGMTVAQLRSAATDISSYLSLVADKVERRYVAGEGMLHGRMMRRYAFAPPANTSLEFLALDREVVIGHEDGAARTGNNREFREWAASIGSRISPTRDSCELDILGVLPDGAIALIELKDSGDSIADAAQQLAFYAWRFNQLRQSSPDALSGISKLADQKARLGLIPVGDKAPKLRLDAPFVPIIAATDESPGSSTKWRREAKAAVGRDDGLLENLRLWHLDADGRILDSHD